MLDLVDDGHELAGAFADAGRLPPSKRGATLDTIVRPVIQVASPEERCEHSGLRLYDIWRYFRHTWSLEYRATPGRSLAFLIRNAARPNAPVMGIASIANAALQLRVRDDWIGWSTAATVASLECDPEGWPGRLQAMIRAVNAARQEIRADDLMQHVGDVEKEELEKRLRSLADNAKAERRRSLEDRRLRKQRGESVSSLRRLPLDEQGGVDWHAGSDRPLFVKKRAETLANLLFAERVLKGLTDDAVHVKKRERVDKDIRRAISIAVREIRKVGLASRLLDVNVCGAVPPYRDLLVGKLVALAMASREVSDAYRERYRGQVSEIASQLAARPVSRSPDVCLLTTTSLYGVVASQYNRLKITVAVPDGGSREIRWRDLGLTEGWGTTHFSEATIDALRRFSEHKIGSRNVNNVFGEGQSPRLRQAREGLSILGLDPETYLKHRHARRVYALELVEDARKSLCLNETASAERPDFQTIAAAWRDRWLGKRILRPNVRIRLASQGQKTIREELAVPQGAQISVLQRSNRPYSAMQARDTLGGFMAKAEHSEPRLIQSLYLALGACADHHSEATVDLLHIATPVDDFVREKAPGRVVFVTGNPGDGKTHVLRRLSDDLADANVEVLLDANEKPNDELLDAIRRAARNPKRGLAIAINEGILVQILRDGGTEPWATSVRRQLLSPLTYRETDGEEDDRFVVIDLSLRNNLSPEIVKAALRRMLSISAPCETCPGAGGCSLQANVARLQRDSIPDRVGALFDSVASVGVHATMRDLHGFLAFLMNGEQTCDDEDRDIEPYWLNVFEGGEGALFEAVRRFDPAKVTHPLLDDALWRKADGDDSWSLSWPRLIDSSVSLVERFEEFQAVKRRALFEHEDGAALLRSSDLVDNELRELLEGGTGATRRCVRLINRFFDRDEERTENLYLWMTHRYDANVPRHAAAVLPVPIGQLKLLVPRLRPSLQAAFPNYRPDHAVLVANDKRPQDGLRIDRPLLKALLAAEQGLPSNFRRGEPEARIAAFISKLASLLGDPSTRDQIAVRLVDRDTGNNVEVTIDLRGRRYVRR